jgi:site-specific recombinase XerD
MGTVEYALSRPITCPTKLRLVQARGVQAERLMTAPSPYSLVGRRDRALLETLYGTGLRRGECARLDVQDVDLREGTLLVRNGKGSKDRLVPVPRRAALALDGYLRDARPELARNPAERALFLTAWGGRRLAKSAWWPSCAPTRKQPASRTSTFTCFATPALPTSSEAAPVSGTCRPSSATSA